MYSNIRDDYKKNGRNHKIYIDGEQIKLKNLSDDKLLELSKRFKKNHETMNRYSSNNRDSFLAYYENIEEYIKYRRFEKIIKLKKKIKGNIIKRFFKLFKLW